MWSYLLVEFGPRLGDSEQTGSLPEESKTKSFVSHVLRENFGSYRWGDRAIAKAVCKTNNEEHCHFSDGGCFVAVIRSAGS
jgi:hypothetical protein